MKPLRREVNRRYKDIDLDLIVHPHTNDIVGRYDEEALTGSIINIIRTRRGERVFNPDFGSNIYSSLFEPMSSATRIMLEAQIENALEQHEPRITLQYVKITAEEEMNRYNVIIAYVPVSSGNMVEIEFFLNRLR
jgi:phage baseplate assembly protein W